MKTHTRWGPSDVLREVIRDRGLTAYRVAKMAGVAIPSVHRFLRHERGITAETFDALAVALGLRLVEVGTTRRRPRAAASELVTVPSDEAGAHTPIYCRVATPEQVDGALEHPELPAIAAAMLPEPASGESIAPPAG
jgi:hypothetical protein